MPITRLSSHSEQSEILSQEKSFHKILFFVGAILILIVMPALLDMPKEVGRGEYKILLVLVFPFFGLYVLMMGWNQKKKYEL